MTGRTLKRAEQVDGALRPALTVWDRRVLNAVPVAPEWDDLGWSPAGRGLDPWMIARAIRKTDVAAVASTLRGLQDRHLVRAIGYDTSRKFQRWVRNPPGWPDDPPERQGGSGPSASGSPEHAPSQRPEAALNPTTDEVS